MIHCGERKGIILTMSYSVTCTLYMYLHNVMCFSLRVQFSTPSVWDYIYKFPVTFLTYDVRSVDDKSHTVRLYYDNSAEVHVYDIL